MSTAEFTTTPDWTLVAPPVVDAERVITRGALAFVTSLTRRFAPRIRELLAAREERQARFDRGERPAFLDETRAVREVQWTVAPPPSEIADRRVEITGPVDRKMIINALNSGASAFMADFEDATTPTWENLVAGQANLMDAVRRTIRYASPDGAGKVYELDPRPAVLFVRPRGLHLPESHLRVDGGPVPGALFDFGLYAFHNAEARRQAGKGIYLYLPKLESHLEARLWNDVFEHVERALGLPRGTVRATALIETLPAAFEMDEILYELREHSAGLNCGRWDYIFSFIKKLRNDPSALTPDRAQITMDKGFLHAYARLLVETCHRRGAHAMGGMATQIPVRGDAAANQRALDAVRADKLREVRMGHDGTWVAHPGLVPVARAIFDEHMPAPNQIGRDDVARSSLTAANLLAMPGGTRTEEGLRHNVRVGILYLEAWLRGNGCVPLYNLMEDAATAEISRAQVWQWQRHHARLADGSFVDDARVRVLVADEIRALVAHDERLAASETLAPARWLFERLAVADELAEFVTLPAYWEILRSEDQDHSPREQT